MPADRWLDNLAEAEQQRAATMRRRWASLVFLAYMGFMLVRFDLLFASDTSGQNAEGQLSNQLISIGLALLLFFTTWRRHGFADFLSRSWPYVLLLTYCLFSVSWSITPDIAIRRWVQMVISFWVIWHCCFELGYACTLRLTRNGLMALLVLNFLAVALLSRGIHQYQYGLDPGIVGAWRGITNNKNMAGPICCMTILFYLFDKRNVSKAYHAFVVLLAAIFLYFTQSKSSMLSLSIAILAGVAISMFDYAGAYKALVRRVILASLTFPLFLVLAFEKLQSHFDREAFSGRMRIWSTMMLYARDHFWTGAGFSSFWRSGKVSPVFQLTEGWVAELAAAGHNSYFDLLVTIGFPGLVLSVAALVLYPVWRLLASDTLPPPCRSLLFSIIIFCVFNSLAESQFLDGRGVDQTFLTMTCALIALAPVASTVNWAFLRRRSTALQRDRS